MSNEYKDWLRENDLERIEELKELIQGEGCEEQCEIYKAELEELYVKYSDLGN